MSKKLYEVQLITTVIVAAKNPDFAEMAMRRCEEEIIISTLKGFEDTTQKCIQLVDKNALPGRWLPSCRPFGLEARDEEEEVQDFYQPFADEDTQ